MEQDQGRFSNSSGTRVGASTGSHIMCTLARLFIPTILIMCSLLTLFVVGLLRGPEILLMLSLSQNAVIRFTSMASSAS